MPIPATPGRRRACLDYEYERNGTASLFLFTEPLTGFRQATARERPTGRTGRLRWRTCWIRGTPTASVSRWSWDNLNTHTKGAFYEAFEPAVARALRQADRVLLHAEARQLAERRGMRTQLSDESVLERSTYR